MSVILDALKRVQDENRRRGMDPSLADDETVRDADAMVERLSTPAADLPPWLVPSGISVFRC